MDWKELDVVVYNMSRVAGPLVLHPEALNLKDTGKGCFILAFAIYK